MRARAWSAWLPPPLISSLIPDVHYMCLGESATYCEDVARYQVSTGDGTCAYLAEAWHAIDRI